MLSEVILKKKVFLYSNTIIVYTVYYTVYTEAPIAKGALEL